MGLTLTLTLTLTRYTVRISYLELYNEAGFDLLDSRQSSAGAYGGGGGELGRVSAVSEDEHGEVTLRGLSSHVASTEEEALNPSGSTS